MTTAIKTVHLEKGPWVTEGGWEYNAVLIAAIAGLVETGPAASLDEALGTELSGSFWAFAALAAGIGGAFANLAQSAPAPETVASAPADVR